MFRFPGFMKLTVLAAVVLAACDRSGTAPTPATTPAPDLYYYGVGQPVGAPAHGAGTVVDTLGYWGGSLVYSDPLARGLTYRLEVPVGAVWHNTVFRMEIPAGSTYEVHLTAFDRGQDVGKAGFYKPVQLKIGVGSANFFNHYPSQAAIVWLPETGGKVPVSTSIDYYRKYASANLAHFSKWSLYVW